MFGQRARAIGLVVLVLAVAGCAATIGGSTRPRHGRPAARLDISIFYEDLAPYGHWFVYGSYGWAWTPYDVPYGWRPYTHGHWIYTECGWTWVSHWRWGWAAFHYGRWVFDPDYGWIWIPDTLWGPAWVVWRWSDDWVGWAPLPPDVRWKPGGGLGPGERHPRWDLDPSWWSFTRPGRLLDRDVRYKLEPEHRNVTLIERTRALADYDEFEGRPRNRGRDVAEVEKLVRLPVERFRVVEAGAPAEGERMKDRGEVRVYRPPLAPAPELRPPVTEPAPRAVAPDAERLRREREVRKVDGYYREEKSRMESRQRTEVRQAPPGDAEALRRTHEAEQRALEEQKARERKVREVRIEKRIEKPAPARRPETRGQPSRGKTGG
jgi:hypothetical protein